MVHAILRKFSGWWCAMPISFSMMAFSAAESLLWVLFAVFFWRSGRHARFPVLSKYLTVQAISNPVLSLLLYGQAQHWFNDYCFLVYYCTFWIVYFTSTVLMLFVTQEIFCRALDGFSGLSRLGLIAFRWAALVSVVFSLATVHYGHHHYNIIIGKIGYGLMRATSILELCLLAFLCLSMNALKINYKDTTFGFSLGFGVMATSDFMQAAFTNRHTGFNSPIQYACEAVAILGLLIWNVYAAMPAVERKPVVVAANSTIYRWNEIASALGHSPKVAMQPATSFFLSDVERVVEKVLERNLKSSESEV